MPAELIGTDDLLRDLLVADVPLLSLVGKRVFPDQAPQGAAFPYVIIGFLSAVDTDTVDGYRVFTQPLYLVKAVTMDSNWFTAGQIVARIDAVLQQASGSRPAQGIEIQSIVREQVTRYIETPPPQATPIRHYGGQYRMFVSYT